MLAPQPSQWTTVSSLEKLLRVKNAFELGTHALTQFGIPACGGGCDQRCHFPQSSQPSVRTALKVCSQPRQPLGKKRYGLKRARGLIPAVASEELIAPIPRQGHRHRLPRQL